MTDLTALDLTEASARLDRGEIDAVALTRAYLDRIERLGGALNCFVAVTAEAALAQAREADRRRAEGRRLGPLDGIPVALKDNIDLAGLPTGNGMGPRGDTTARRDSEAARRLRAGGVVFLGKLNMHEGALGGSTDNPHHGRAHNPWRRGFTPGGSSGGSGVAVAARLCAAALGTDTMGSVRLPAAYCGVVGLKPTFGLVSTRGVAPLSWQLDHVGPLCRSVHDLGPLLTVLAGHDPEEPSSVRAPAGTDYAVPDAPDVAGLRLGWLTNFDAVEIEPAVRRAVDAAVGLLERCGCASRRIEIPGYEPSRARRAGLLISEAEGAVAHEADLEAYPDAFSEGFRAMLAYGRDASAARFVKAQRLAQRLGFAFRRAFAQADLIVSATAPQVAFPFGTAVPVSQADLTAIANFGGCPALSLPCGLSDDGLPVGLQMIAAPFQEARLLAAARAFERAADLRLAPPELEGA